MSCANSLPMIAYDATGNTAQLPLFPLPSLSLSPRFISEREGRSRILEGRRKKENNPRWIVG